MPDFPWSENAVQLAEMIENTLEDKKKPYAGDAARLVVKGLRGIIGENDDVDVIAMKFAMTIARMMAVFASETVMDLSETVDNTMTAYAMAAGVLAGGYVPPACGECEPGSSIPDTIPEEWGNSL